MQNKRISLAAVALILAILACTAPTAQAPQNANGNYEATITALAATIAAQNGAPASTQAPQDTPQPTETATITPTPTPSVPMVSVSQVTNCRTGPSTAYDIVGGMNIGQFAQVVGKYTPANWWVIKNPNGNGNCWMWGQYATVTGDTSSLPEMIPPPTPTPSLPAAPKAFSVQITCTKVLNPVIQNKVHISLSWSDEANNEDGYHIYRDGNLIGTTGSNANSYSDDTTLPAIWIFGNPPPSLTYGVQAFNGAGTSVTKEKEVICP
jgi:uncharacterized protein YgiM (DUF1202 family)